MRVKALRYRGVEEAKNLVFSLNPLFDARKELLHPSQFWTEGAIPAAPHRIKLRSLILFPGKDAPYRGIDLVGLGRRAARLLEERSGLVLDWAAGIRGGYVYLLVKPMAWPAKGGRMVGFRPGPDDLEALRGLVPSSGRRKSRERGR